ncbi:hypothetical protein NM688_g8553 [Phlebia brevispora]|uniref:Uncharacterized protein n=1 Tax=Phlebia brevispora TaxID=194682 RepID=A0ACC1RQW0_9APHY|nr:hypothetical protein NM688_g8553 [Phlebia brevispora]
MRAECIDLLFEAAPKIQVAVNLCCNTVVSSSSAQLSPLIMLSAHIKSTARALGSLPHPKSIPHSYRCIRPIGIRLESSYTRDGSTRYTNVEGSSTRYGMKRRRVDERRMGSGDLGESSQQRSTLRTNRPTNTRGNFSKYRNSNAREQRPLRAAYTLPGEESSNGVRRPRQSTRRNIEMKPSSVVVVSKLPKDVTSEEFSALSTRFAPIRSIRLSGYNVTQQTIYPSDKISITVHSDRQPGSVAQITFFTPEDAARAMNSRPPIEMRGRKLSCRLLTHDDLRRIQDDDNRRDLVVYNVPSELPLDEIRKAFNEVAPVANIKTDTDEITGERRRSMTIEFPTAADARRVFERHKTAPFDLGEGELEIKFLPREDQAHEDTERYDRNDSRFLRVSGRTMLNGFHTR